MAPSEFVLDRRVRSGGDHDLAATNLPFFILKCKDWKAHGYADDELEIYNEMLQSMVIGVRVAKPPAVSYLAILGAPLFAEIVAIDKTVIVISLGFTGVEGPMSYLIYDAVALSLRMIPQPETLDSSGVSIARPCHGGDYALVHTGILSDDEDEGDVSADEDIDADDKDDSLFLWRPSSSSLSWMEKKKSSLPDVIDWSVDKTDTEFSFNGYAYWVDLLCGVSYCSCDALFDDTTSVVEFGGFISLPVKPGVYDYDHRIAEPAAYRTMGIVRHSFIRFISIDGFKKKKHTVTVWKLLDHDKGWEKEYELSMETLCGFEGFGDLPKDLMPMYPLLSTKDADVVYLMLGKYQKFVRSDPHYLLAVDMRNKIVTSVPRADWFPESVVSCDFSWRLRKALVGPCDDEGVCIRRKKKRRSDEGNAAEALIPMKKHRLEKPICC